MSRQSSTQRRATLGVSASIEGLTRSLEVHQIERTRIIAVLNVCDVTTTNANIEEVGRLLVRRAAVEHLIERVQVELEAARAAASAPLSTEEISSAENADAERRRLERKGAISQRLEQLDRIIGDIEQEVARSGVQNFRRSALLDARKEHLRLQGEQHRLTVAGHLCLREQLACEIEFVRRDLDALSNRRRIGLTRPLALDERIAFTQARLDELQTELDALPEQTGEAAA